MKALIDLDIVLYRGIFACEDQGFHAQRRACDSILTSILDTLQPDSYTLALTGPGNFRKQLNPEYKAHRKKPPENLYDVKQYFVKYWNAILTKGIEADDYIAMHSTPQTVIVSSDKDYKTIPNTWLYHPWKNEMCWNDQEEAEYFFYMQCLTGDSADNVKGIYGIGPKKAQRILKGKSKDEMRDAVMATYREHYPDDWFDRLDMTATMLFLLREPNSTYVKYYL